MADGEITTLLREWRDGKPHAIDRLFEAVYPRLRQIAGALFRGESLEQVLQPTSVVNELFLKLGKVAPEDRRFGMSHYLWAEALVVQGRTAEALPHAKIGARLLTRNAVSVGGRKAGKDAEELLGKLESSAAPATAAAGATPR